MDTSTEKEDTAKEAAKESPDRAKIKRLIMLSIVLVAFPVCMHYLRHQNDEDSHRSRLAEIENEAQRSSEIENEKNKFAKADDPSLWSPVGNLTANVSYPKGWPNDMAPISCYGMGKLKSIKVNDLPYWKTFEMRFHNDMNKAVKVYRLDTEGDPVFVSKLDPGTVLNTYGFQPIYRDQMTPFVITTMDDECLELFIRSPTDQEMEVAIDHRSENSAAIMQSAIDPGVNINTVPHLAQSIPSPSIGEPAGVSIGSAAGVK